MPTLPKEGNFVLVEFKINNKKVFYAGKVLKDAENGETDVTFLRRDPRNGKFRLPNVPDVAVVLLSDVKMFLPNPSYSGQRKRQQGCYTFDLDFSRIDIR